MITASSLFITLVISSVLIFIILSDTNTKDGV